MSQLPKFLTDKNFLPNISINPDFLNLGTEVAFSFGAKVTELEKSGRFPQIYKFHIGDTGPKTPEPIIEVAIQALKDKQTKYAPFLGFPNVRENIARYWTQTRGVEVTKENVMLTPAGKVIIELAIQTFSGPDSFIVGQNPAYSIYKSLACFYNQNRFISWDAGDKKQTGELEFFVEDLENILKQNNQVKLLILNTPQNPTGMMLTKNKLMDIAQLANKYNFYILFDDIYDQIVFDGKEQFSLLSIPGMLDRVINLNGYSKNFAMTGWRMGIVVAPEWLIEVFGQLAINKWSCVSRVNQIVAGAIFGDVEVDGFKYASVAEKIKPILAADLQEYESKGKFLVSALNLLRPYIYANPVEGAFYDFPSFAGVLKLKYVQEDLNIKSDKDFCNWLLNEKGIATLAGSDFGSMGAGHVRFSYAEDRDKHIIPGVKCLLKIVIELIEKSGEIAPLKIEEVDGKVGELEKIFFM